MAQIPVFTWCPRVNASSDVKFDTRKAQFGDGYEQVSSLGLNAKRQEWKVEFVGDEAYIAPIRDFLDVLQGYQAFVWVPPGEAKGLFRCEVYSKSALGKNSKGEQMYGVSATFRQAYSLATDAGNVGIKPTITTQPQSDAYVEGTGIKLTVVAAGSTPFTYQWTKGGVVVGSNSDTLQIVRATAADAGFYKVKVTNSAGNATSDEAEIRVDPLPIAPVITTHPQSVSIAAGADLVLTAAATGVLTWRWEHQNGPNWDIVANQTGAKMTIAKAGSADAGVYRAIAINNAGQTESNPANVVVN